MKFLQGRIYWKEMTKNDQKFCSEMVVFIFVSVESFLL